ncbi:MAG: hypothetical protein VKI42_05455 [Synechococcaceae cyanobacterium]|nr:hypothetical protein [Synechococcaceae cyanobacterium]
MTRDCLRPLEGQLVFFQATPAEASRSGDGRRQVLLKGVKVWRFTADQPAGQGQPDAAVDHLWLEVEDDTRIPLLTPCVGLGRVRWYSRRDGSTDLGLSRQLSVDLDVLISQLAQHRGASPEALLPRIEAALVAVADGLAYSVSLPVRACQRALEIHRQMLQQQLHPHPRRQRHRPGRGRRGFAALLPPCPQAPVEAGR